PLTSSSPDLISRIKGTTQTIAKLTELHDRSAPGPTTISGNNATSASTLIPENVRLQPEPFYGDPPGIIYKALQWAQAFLAPHPITHLAFERFLGEFRLNFDQPRKQEEATRRLLSLKQGNRPVSEHLIDFRILAATETSPYSYASDPGPRRGPE
uniref:Retrotransposon gag domain-containing protein n=1 Tax=Oryzias sinensis TaxID=183150 RepID=A0A8C7YFK3_9TELE